MTIGGQSLIEKFGSRLAVAEALILGNVKLYQEHVSEVVTPVLLEAARIRLEALGRLTPEHVQEA